MTTKLDKIPDGQRISAADFTAHEKLIQKWFMEPQAPPTVGRIVTPPNNELEQAFHKLMMVAKQLKGDTARFPTMDQCRAEMKRQKAERDARNFKLYGKTYND
jgi:hypothetical protein